ncbi:glycoside hydrolase family 76 protein [Mucilaginibacter aquatilis]|uniref:Hydrolase n=1 Tax=Mucilaginibacter aquatilis TaxID=1517760 RepID=A0A6I4IHP3_9SPHI|nr:glycoside hydrolase family 76 protein [Mucilaginibacter aquatilis]MVN93026.1 hydrolase [Mucilaginibacter aquatilis]
MQKLKILTVAVFCCAAVHVSAQIKDEKAHNYLQRAETMYNLVWKRYRVPAQPGLFKENYPDNKKDSLNYMQGGGVAEKQVSFLWPFSGVFSATNALMHLSSSYKLKYKRYQDTLVHGIELYADSKRQPLGYQAYPVKFEKADRYYDDNGLVGIDYMESYLVTRNPLYLKRAKQVFKFIESGWNNDAGGGVTWLEGHKDQKPACSNGMATLTALKIYQGSKDKAYLEAGKRYYNWMYKTLKDTNGVIANDIKTGSNKLNHVYWTYNTGSLIEAAVLLHQFTNDKQYLREAQQMAADSYKYFSSKSRNKNLPIAIDLPWFVTVLFRGYAALYNVDGNYTYIKAVEDALNYAWTNSRDEYGFITHTWLPNAEGLKKPKWLLDEACIAELYTRLSQLQNNRK